MQAALRVLVVRHAEAEELSHTGGGARTDAERALTKDGIAHMRKGVRGLRTLVDDIAVIHSSPLKRAVQTADLLAEGYPHAKTIQHARLSPGFDPEKLLDWLAQQREVVALVGHEPDLSQWIGYLTTHTASSIVQMKKGSVCCLEMPEAGMAGEARIRWLLTLKQLAKLDS
jgi:phosphohistidine phosphatase